ncbi:hypothetical protein [Rhodococcus sp. NPDC057529]
MAVAVGSGPVRRPDYLDCLASEWPGAVVVVDETHPTQPGTAGWGRSGA